MKRWFYERFLPMWAKETLLQDYRLLRRENDRLRQTLREKEAYIKGLHKGMGKRRCNQLPKKEGNNQELRIMN